MPMLWKDDDVQTSAHDHRGINPMLIIRILATTGAVFSIAGMAIGWAPVYYAPGFVLFVIAFIVLLAIALLAE